MNICILFVSDQKSFAILKGWSYMRLSGANIFPENWKKIIYKVGFEPLFEMYDT